MNAGSEIFLEAADRIGARLCREAIWAGNRCNWVGPPGLDLAGGTSRVATRALGPDLYEGTAGIALFLTVLYGSTGERVFEKTAEGAIRQALSRLDDITPDMRCGFYCGLVGVAYVLLEVSTRLDLSKFTPMAMFILDEVGKESPTSQRVDVVSGIAGAIPVLLNINQKHSAPSLIELAIRHAEHLIARSESLLDSKRMEGLAMGRAGIAMALMELYSVTGRDKFRDTALRLLTNAPNPPKSLSQLNWFEGVAGVGMSRLRAFQILADEVQLQEAKEAINTVVGAISKMPVKSAEEEYSLAYGLTGVGELLLFADEVLNNYSIREKAEEIGHRGINSYLRRDLPWPCGTKNKRETPSLMPGLAGIGYYYLRLYDKRLPSLLIVKNGVTQPSHGCA